MFRIKNFEDNNDVKIVEEMGAFNLYSRIVVTRSDKTLI